MLVWWERNKRMFCTLNIPYYMSAHARWKGATVIKNLKALKCLNKLVWMKAALETVSKLFYGCKYLGFEDSED